MVLSATKTLFAPASITSSATALTTSGLVVVPHVFGLGKETFGFNKKYATNDEEMIVAKYCLNPRIDKAIFKLNDDGIDIDMPMMRQLPQYVYKDMIEEHWEDICHSKYVIDFHKLKKLVTTRCLRVLKQVITNNALVKE